jgi:UDP-2,3-diacylglucosamine hydrolase
MNNPTSIFISDAHFGIPVEGCELREQYFDNFIEQLPPGVTDLFLIGDLFDFWIEFKSVIRSDYVPVLFSLRKALQRGIKVHYLPGNHDFALGAFLSDVMGINILNETQDITVQGRKVHLYHGDGLIKRDVGYRILKPLLRNRIYQNFYKLLHPDIGIAMGTFFSGSSRKYQKHRITEQIIKEYRECARQTIDKGYDYVIYGHTHHAELCHFDHGTYLNTGSWLIHYNYATMTEGKIDLWQYRPDSSPLKINALDLK